MHWITSRVVYRRSRHSRNEAVLRLLALLLGLLGALWAIDITLDLPRIWPAYALLTVAVLSAVVSLLAWFELVIAGVLLVALALLALFVSMFGFYVSLYFGPALSLIASGGLMALAGSPAARAALRSWRTELAWGGGLKVAAATAVVGAAITVLNFLYANLYEPSVLPPEGAVTSKLLADTTNMGLQAITATVTFKNSSRTQVHLLVSTFNAEGVRLKRRELNNQEYAAAVATAAADSSVASRYGNWCEQEAVQQLFAKSPIGSGPLQPGSDITATFVFWIPANTYDLVRGNNSPIIRTRKRTLECGES